MPYFYHVSRGFAASNLEKKLDSDKPVFFSKKDYFWNDLEKKIGLSSFKGYREYELFIFPSLFTETLTPRTRNKILKVTKNNEDKIRTLIKNFMRDNGCFDRSSFLEELKRRNFIGIDTHYVIKDITNWNQELIIFDLSDFLPLLKLVNVVKSK